MMWSFDTNTQHHMQHFTSVVFGFNDGSDVSSFTARGYVYQCSTYVVSEYHATAVHNNDVQSLLVDLSSTMAP